MCTYVADDLLRVSSLVRKHLSLRPKTRFSNLMHLAYLNELTLSISLILISSELNELDELSRFDPYFHSV